MAFTASATSPTSIRVNITVISGYSYYEIAYRPSYTSTATFIKFQHTSNFSYTLTGLEAGQAYVVNVGYATSYDGPYSFMGAKTVQLPDAPSLTHWVWPNGYEDMLANHGALSGFSYTVWNSLVSKINEVVNATGYTWSNQYATIAQTQMTASDRAMTAVRFNSALYNIGSHYATGLTFQQPGNVVYGSFFLTLADKLNDWIDYSGLG